ncbi:hypothetical protein K6V78_01585 [Streptococcus gallolyticus]|uniref:hypothetical protein n=1 Tax=Streptococcus hepaticus TaxID=3349163 RepID=UPI001C95D390|nr:hypothetical protein [Streptococcus gallolyticus]MBY5040057.1 hypothetical protein [Streptococcus gallolyticus]
MDWLRFTIGTALFLGAGVADVVFTYQQTVVEAATVEDYSNFSSTWSLSNQINNPSVGNIAGSPEYKSATTK